MPDYRQIPMPQPDSEKDNYTIDEMMRRLSRRQETEPELVTREDGSQALKFKRRKRRTDQSAKKETKLKTRIHILQIAGTVLLLTIVCLVVGVGVLYVNSAGYRDSLTSKLEISSGAEVEMQQFRMNPVSANTRSMNLLWPAGSVLDKMDVYGVTAKISPSLCIGKTFGGDEVVADSGKLFLKVSDPSKPLRYVLRPEGGLPVKFSRYSMPFLDINFGGFGAITKTEVSLYPGTVAGQAEIRLSGGVLQFAGWPSMTLDRSYILIKNSEFKIQNMRFQMPVADQQSRAGYIDFAGTLSPIGATATNTLSAKLENFPLSHLIGNDLGRFFVGRIDSPETPDSNFLSFDINSPEDARLELTVTKTSDSQVDMSGFKFLQLLAIAFSDRWYEFPIFDEDVAMVVKRMGQNTEISAINLEKQGRMVVRGNISNGEGGAIKGKLRIGIPETTVLASGDKKLAKMFGQVREGYRWLDLDISGTGAVPEDDFWTIYKDTSSEESSTSDQETLKDSFDDLIKGE